MTAAAILAIALMTPHGGINLTDTSRLFGDQQNMSRKIGKALRVTCDLCADGNITLNKGIRVSLYKDARFAIDGFSMGESMPNRGAFILHRYRSGTAANLFEMTHPATDREDVANHWYRLIAGVESRAVSGGFAPRLTLALVIFEAEPHPIFRGREREVAALWHVSAAELASSGLLRRQLLVMAPGLDFAIIGPASIHLEAMYAHALDGGIPIAAGMASLSFPF
ncbi:MAG: hypothetical protein AAB692_02110 [Patescibacteria group bacterium]